MNTERYLITTADERSWKFDRPVLFLGEWCRLYHRKEVWTGMNAIVADPYRLEKEQKRKDLIYLQSLTAQLLHELTDALNHFHHTDHNIRYWNIILGNWLQRYVSVAINRYFNLQEAFEKNKISGTAIFNLPNYTLATSNSIDFQWALYDDLWNHIFYSRVLNFWGLTDTELLNLIEPQENRFMLTKDFKPKPKIKSILSILLNKALKCFSRCDDALVINSYLPSFYSLKLHLSLGQCPSFWNTPEIQSVAFNFEMRKNFRMEFGTFSGFEYFIRSLLPEVIPTCYLEGYSQLLQQSQELPWPSNPKFIFTSNNFDTDELFKIWTAQKVKKGHKYYIGQHGSLYGTWIYHTPDIPEYSTPDKFISWGWRNEDQKVYPAFIFKTINKKPRKKIQEGGLLLIERCLYNRYAVCDRYVDHDIYQKEQFRFVDSLSENIKKILTVRLHRHEPSNLKWSDEQRWKDHNPSINLELGFAKISNMIKGKRLIVYSYDSTGLLETLSLNIPTMGFWYNLFDEILPEARPYYDLLRDAGILAETPEIAAKLINANWERLGEWWFSKNVQVARITFCNKYAKRVDRPISYLKKILVNHIEE